LQPTEEILHLVQSPTDKVDRQRLVQLIEHLLEKDFMALINLLYRLDVDEDQIRTYAEEKFLTAEVLANFIEQRLLMRAHSRELFNKRYTKDSDDDLVDKW
jgi:hypothetical protein